MPPTTASVHIVPTSFADDREKKNRFRFTARRRSSELSLASLADSVGTFGSGLIDMFGSSEPKIHSPGSEDNIAPRARHQDIEDLEDTFATAASPSSRRYDPSRLTPPNAAADFDLDGMSDDDIDDSASELPHLDESYVIDETTGQRFYVPSANNNNNKKKNKEKLPIQPRMNYTFPSPSSFCKQLVGVATVTLIILLLVGLVVFAFMITGSGSSSTPQTDSSDIDSGSDSSSSSSTGLELLLYNTEVAVNAACTKENADWEELWYCRELCRSSMCCFEIFKSKSCYQGNERSCHAHSACTVLNSFPSQIVTPYNTEREKLVLSEMIVNACSRERLDTNIGYCQKLCKNMLCCFEEEELYNCARVKGEECAVHAACEALVSGH
jgi:hypothetical protein